jgi:Flp pilus assembly protein TadG
MSRPKSVRSLVRSTKGQASVMIGMMMMTFLLFFTFVVNTGMLVHAKINLQNAADLAAYAGAATQARQLNTISYLNYEMRRQYKKFLFRYYVMGNVAQSGFPQAPGSKSAHTWTPGPGMPNYGTPAVCLIFNSSDNFCQLVDLPKIVQTPPSPTDLINQTLNEQLAALELIRESNCGKIAQANVDVLLLWLYNTDPSLQNLPNTLSDPNAKGIITVTQAVAQGLGLVPREIILRERIKTMQGYVNESAKSGVSKSVADGLKTSTDPVGSERTIQAFYSAYDTLGPNIFDDQYVQMDELVPQGGDGANLLGLNDVQVNFDAYAIGYLNQNGGDCHAVILPVPIKKLPVGIAKDPTVLTYYAIRLKARAKVMFSPFGDMDIKAYAAARPFGSRLGPPYSGDDDQFSFQNTPANLNTSGSPFLTQAITGFTPNLPISAGDTASLGQGWDTDFILGTMYQALGANQSQPINSSNADAGYTAAMVPNPYEGNLYNIMNDTGNDPFVRNFDTNHQALLWAPVFPPGGQASLQNELKDALAEIYSTPGAVGNNGPGSFGSTSASDTQLQQSLLNDMLTYINLLPQRQGENGEGMNVAVITDPFTSPGPGGQALNLSPDIMMNAPQQYKTSFVTTNNSDYTAQGRVGYSVKFVSFDSLTAHRASSNGATMWGNALNIDEEAKSDGLTQIQH